MPRKPGRKSKADLEVVSIASGSAGPAAPQDLDADARALWDAIVKSRPTDFYTPGDLPLLREYCYTVSTLIPKANEAIADNFDHKTLDARDKLVRLAASLAGKLRICVSSRTRPDTAGMRDSVRPPSWESPWEFGGGPSWDRRQ